MLDRLRVLARLCLFGADSRTEESDHQIDALRYAMHIRPKPKRESWWRRWLQTWYLFVRNVGQRIFEWGDARIESDEILPMNRMRMEWESRRTQWQHERHEARMAQLGQGVRQAMAEAVRQYPPSPDETR